MAFQFFYHTNEPKLVGQSSGPFPPQFRAKSLYLWQGKVLVRAQGYLEIDPETLSCKPLDLFGETTHGLCVSPDGKHMFALGLDMEIPYLLHVFEDTKKKIPLDEFASRNTNFLYSVIVCDNERLVLINPTRMYTWKIAELAKNAKPFEFENNHAAGCEYACFAMRKGKLLIGDDREHYGGRLVSFDLDTGKFENLFDKSVSDVIFDDQGQLWTINKLPNGDPGKICRLEKDGLKVVSSITRPNPEKNEGKIAYNWDFPVTQFQKLFLNDKGELVVATDTEGFFKYDPKTENWLRKGPGKIFGLEAFEKIMPLPEDHVFVAGHINNDCTFMIYNFAKNSYRLIQGDPAQLKEK